MVGNIRANRLPEGMIFSSSTPRGAMKGCRIRNIPCSIASWVDKKAVYFISTAHKSPTEKYAVERRLDAAERRQSNISRDDPGIAQRWVPKVCHVYNQNMGGVDRADQLWSYYHCDSRNGKWTDAIFLSS